MLILEIKREKIQSQNVILGGQISLIYQDNRELLIYTNLALL